MLLRTCVALSLLVCAVEALADFVIDDFTEGGPFLLSTRPEDGALSATSTGINVPGGERRIAMRSVPDSDRIGSIELPSGPDPIGLIANGENPPNSGFIIGTIMYGGSDSFGTGLDLDATGHGDHFYFDLSEGDPPSTRWSGFYIVFSTDAGTPFFPEGTGSQNFLAVRGSGRYKIPFSHFGSRFDPTDIDAININLWSLEGRATTPPLILHEFGITIPEPSGALLAGTLVGIIAGGRRSRRQV